MSVKRHSDRTKFSAIALVHQSGLDLTAEARRHASTRELWRLRNWEDHPLDPGWEDGRYCVCHRRFRNSETRRKGEIVVDCVNDRRVDELGYPVRSFFEIHDFLPCSFSGSCGIDLVFLSYHFCDGEQPFRLKIKIGPSGTYLTFEQLGALITHTSYRRYDITAESGPFSIASEDWRKMVRTKNDEKARLASRKEKQDRDDCRGCGQ